MQVLRLTFAANAHLLYGRDKTFDVIVAQGDSEDEGRTLLVGYTTTSLKQNHTGETEVVLNKDTVLREMGVSDLCAVRKSKEGEIYAVADWVFIALSHELQRDANHVINDHECRCGLHSNINLVCDKNKSKRREGSCYLDKEYDDCSQSTKDRLHQECGESQERVGKAESNVLTL